jgi:hypothetical protein
MSIESGSCPECRKPIPKDARKCPYCGAQFRRYNVWEEFNKKIDALVAESMAHRGKPIIEKNTKMFEMEGGHIPIIDASGQKGFVLVPCGRLELCEGCKSCTKNAGSNSKRE